MFHVPHPERVKYTHERGQLTDADLRDVMLTEHDRYPHRQSLHDLARKTS